MLTFIFWLEHYPKMDGANFISSIIINNKTNIIPIKNKIRKSFLFIGTPFLIMDKKITNDIVLLNLLDVITTFILLLLMF